MGAGPDTGNLGVSALCFSVVHAIAKRRAGALVSVFDSGRGSRRSTTPVEGRPFAYTRTGAWNSFRLYRPESMWNIRAQVALGMRGNPAARAILEADAALDVSGGDSFADLYGAKRFRGVTLLKHTVLASKTPLILLPQTYGPFRDPGRRRIAESIVRRCACAWARDERSFDRLKELLGGSFDPRKHRSGVDVAFTLTPRAPAQPAADWTQDPAMDGLETIGFNVSGLILNGGADAAAQYGLRADYAGVVVAFLRRVLESSAVRILLVPHVLAPRGVVESDLQASEAVLERLGPAAKGRVGVLTTRLDECETKWVISRTAWFCGTRMHATIASLSSGVPTGAISYSDKTLGVFESCGQGAHVHDPRSLSTEELVERLWGSFERRNEARELLRCDLPAVLTRAEAQMDSIVEAVGRGGAGGAA
jgi:polysaccharide pyruvyl transferase WcaK-like protein